MKFLRFKLIAFIILVIGIISIIYGVNHIYYRVPLYRQIIYKLDESRGDTLADPAPVVWIDKTVISLSDCLRYKISQLERLIFFGILNVALGIGLLRLQDWAIYGTIILGIIIVLLCLERLLFLGNLFHLSFLTYIIGIMFYTTIVFVMGYCLFHSRK